MGGAHAASGAGHRGPLALWLVSTDDPVLAFKRLWLLGRGAGGGGEVGRAHSARVYIFPDLCIIESTSTSLCTLLSPRGSANRETTPDAEKEKT